MLHLATCINSRCLARALGRAEGALKEQVGAKTFAVVRCSVTEA